MKCVFLGVMGWILGNGNVCGGFSVLGLEVFGMETNYSYDYYFGFW